MIRYPCKCSETDTGHDYVKEAQIDPEGGIIYTVQCAVCGHLSGIPKDDWDLISKDELRAADRRKVGHTRYPYIEPHTGLEVKSKTHREEVMKHMGFHKAENGVDERYNDETCEALKSKRKAMDARRAAMDDRRKAAGYRRRA